MISFISLVKFAIIKESECQFQRLSGVNLDIKNIFMMIIEFQNSA